MSADNWDLYAVVRSCKSANFTATSAAISNDPVSNGKNTSLSEDPLSSFGSLTFNQEHDPSTFPNLTTTSPLQNSHQPFWPQANHTTTLATYRPIYPSFSWSVNGGYSGQHYQYQKVQRSRKRKNQQKRTVCHVTAENLSLDPWAWRKYGQKPIKGSLYPRNYYRCSSSKGCSARKQVERSNAEPNMFIVTYTSDHTHPRPTHRNSLTGSTRRNRLSTNEKAPEDNVVAAANVQGTGNNGGKDKVALETSANVENGGEDDLLMDNVNVVDDDDLFKGLEELGSSWLTFGDNWGAGNSSAEDTSSGGS